MRRLLLVAIIAPLFFATAAQADDVVVVAPTYGPSKIEAGIYLGGFISNYYHQFYDPELFSETEGAPGVRQELDRVNPQFGGRFAFFPSRYFGFEADVSAILASTKMTGDGAQIYGIGAIAMLQRPGRVTPYFGLGFNVKHVSSDDSVLGSDTDVPLVAAAGIRLWLSRAIALRLDGRFLRGPSFPHPDYTLNASYGEFSLGVSFNPSPGGVAVVEEKPVDKDPDKDGVLDPNDACPNENGGSNPDGCPSKDKDGDGITDAADKCPDQPETMNKWDDQDGCPDTVPDTDNDGLDDMADKCKDQAEDKDGFQDDDGCPDPDNDNDGVQDPKDKCPGTAGPVENNGCPDTDGDGDGIVDRLDNCPEEKGTEKNRGCKTKQLVVIQKDRLQILDQVYFVTGKAKLSKKSNKLLDNMARVLLSHLEIWKVRIEGHTDNVGKPEKNQVLSQARAAAVVAYLVKKGVAPERLEAVGHGDTKPIEDNSTKKGRALNRRVEFHIVNE